MKTSTEIKDLAAALSRAQGAFSAAERAHVAKVQSKKGEGSSYSYNYADLAAYLDVCREPLAANELSVLQSVTTLDDRVSVTTLLMHGSGQFIESDPLTLSADHDPDKHPTPQAIGSATTYARRYSLSAVLGMASEADDDGSAASGVNADTSKREPLPACPNCGKTDAVIIGKPEYGGGYVCYGKKGGCGEKWQKPTEADAAAKVDTTKKAEADRIAAEHGMTTGDKVAPLPSVYEVGLETLAKYTKVSELITFAQWVKEARIAKNLTPQEYADIDSKIAAKACEFPSNEKGFEAAEKLLRGFHGELRITEGDYLQACGKLADAKDSKLGAGA